MTCFLVERAGGQSKISISVLNKALVESSKNEKWVTTENPDIRKSGRDERGMTCTEG